MRHPSSTQATTGQHSSPLGAIHPSSPRERKLHPTSQRPVPHNSEAFLLGDSQPTSNDLPPTFPRPSKEEAEVETDEDMFWSEDDDDDRAIKDNGCTPLAIASGQRDSPATNAVVDYGHTMMSPTSSGSFSAHKSPVSRGRGRRWNALLLTFSKYHLSLLLFSLGEVLFHRLIC